MTDPDTALTGLAAEYWATYLDAHPLFASAIGERGQDGRLPDPTRAGAAALRAGLTTLADRAAALASAAPAAPAGRDGTHPTLPALRAALDADLAALDAGLLDWNVDPLEGVPAGLLLVPDYQRLETPDDGAHAVARWRAMAGYVDQHVATLRFGLADGRVACRAPVERTIEILANLLSTPDRDWPLLRPVDTVSGLTTWAPADRARFASDLEGAVVTGLRPALVRLHSALVDEILPAARPNSAPGMSHVPGGPDGYRALIRAHTSLDLAPEAAHRTGLDEIARIDEEIAALGRRVLGTPTLAATIAALRSDPSLQFGTRDEVFATASASLARAAEAIPGWFGRLPQAPCVVVRMGSHEEEHSTIAYYRQPAADGTRPGEYHINTSHPGTRPRYEAEALAYHESIPGHHLQIAIAQELPGLPEFQRHLGSTAFIEGWGLYVERLADEMGLYSGDLDRLGVLSFDAWRAARLVVDTGMHALDWSRDQAIGFMLAHTALGENNVINEVDRYIVLPAQALAYKTGQLELLRLRRAARDRLGSAFDIRAFHDVVLGSGALPLPTLAGAIEAWLERARPAATPPL